jgi:hypothetical protein
MRKFAQSGHPACKPKNGHHNNNNSNRMRDVLEMLFSTAAARKDGQYFLENDSSVKWFFLHLTKNKRWRKKPAKS